MKFCLVIFNCKSSCFLGMVVLQKTYKHVFCWLICIGIDMFVLCCHGQKHTQAVYHPIVNTYSAILIRIKVV
jgi:hypothetical protein